MSRPSDRDPASVAPPGDEGSFTSIGKGAVLDGLLRGCGLAVVHGLLRGGGAWQGELVVAGDGRVEATRGLRAARMRIEGAAEGTLEATDLLEVVAGSLVEGELRAPTARIEPGARPRARLRLGGGADGPAETVA